MFSSCEISPDYPRYSLDYARAWFPSGNRAWKQCTKNWAAVTLTLPDDITEVNSRVGWAGGPTFPNHLTSSHPTSWRTDTRIGRHTNRRAPFIIVRQVLIVQASTHLSLNKLNPFPYHSSPYTTTKIIPFFCILSFNMPQ